MSGYIGFGKQSVDGPVTAVTKTFRVVGIDEEMCEICEAIGPRDGMHFIASDEDGNALYVCPTAHETAHADPQSTL